jgi:putative phage-type endonuclease
VSDIVVTPQRSAEWFAARKGKTTCSKMAEAIGMVGSRRRLWRVITGREAERDASARMTDGIDYEQIGLAHYEAVRGVKVIPCGFVIHRTHDWIGGSPDGFVGVNGGVEVKCPVTMYADIPDYYMPQVQGLMEVCDRDWWDFAVWRPDAFKITRVFRSVAYWDALLELLCDFQTFLEADVEPPVFKRGTKPRINARVETQLLHQE